MFLTYLGIDRVYQHWMIAQLWKWLWQNISVQIAFIKYESMVHFMRKRNYLVWIAPKCSDVRIFITIFIFFYTLEPEAFTSKQDLAKYNDMN